MTAIHFTASETDTAVTAMGRLMERYGQAPATRAEVIVALGGDGFLLSVLRQNLGRPVYGMNRGTVGFLMNDYAEDDLPHRIAMAEQTVINPLSMVAGAIDGDEYRALAINEVSMLRAGPQAARIRISVDGRVRMEDLVHRVVIRESRHRPGARNGKYYGLMQMSPATARGMGYRGPAQGLLDAETNLKYGVKYLRGAYLVAGGNHDAAVKW